MSNNVDNLKKLDDWFQMFNDAKSLSISEAKELAIKIKQCSDLKEKERLQEELLIGTIKVLKNFIKDNEVFMLCDTRYVDFDDLISSFTLSWIQDLDTKILEVGRFSTLFSREYFEDVASKLGVTEVNDFLQMKNSSYFDTLINCYKAYESNDCYPGSVLYSFKDRTSIDDIEKNLGFVKRGYEKYKETSFVNPSNSGLLGFYGMIFTYIVVNEGCYGREEIFDFVDNIVNQIDVEEYILTSHKINSIQKQLLIEMCGLDGKGERTFSEIAEDYGVDRSKVSQVVAKGLRNLRSDVKVRKYNKN